MTRPDTSLTIAALAARTGFTTKALRYYERIGLLPAPARRPSGYRAYGEGDLARLDFIAKAKRLGLSLDEIREVIAYATLVWSPASTWCTWSTVTSKRSSARSRSSASSGRSSDAFGVTRASARGEGSGICRIIEHAASEVAIGERARVALEFARPARHKRDGRR